MIKRTSRRGDQAQDDVEAKGFDDFELRLGDVMRGERATMGKSLLDVQRELKIKASYIAAIENCDPTAFDTQGFIAGYVRSYARYLNMDPDIAFSAFCNESGFRPAHGMSAAASTVQQASSAPSAPRSEDQMFGAGTPFLPANESVLAGVEPRAVASIGVLAMVIGGLAWGGWTVLQEVQRVQFAPVEQAPVVVAEIDPLAGASAPELVREADVAIAPSAEALDRLYRPQALDVPVLTQRDGPIASLNPSTIGAFAGDEITVADGSALPSLPGLDSGVDTALAAALGGAVEAVPGALGAETVADAAPQVQVTTGPAPELVLVAVRPAWVRVRSAEGATLFEKIMDAGETWEIPANEDPAVLRVGESGAIYFAVNGTHYGPAGPRGSITRELALSVDNLTVTYDVADLSRDSDLAEMVRYAEVQAAAE